MNGFQHLPSQQEQRFWVYTGNKTTSGFQTWSKPPGINFVHIICVGAGGGGASGQGAGGALQAGGGGGSGAMTSVFLPAYLIPDILYINVGLGGAGGAAASTSTRIAGNAGQATIVSFYPDTGLSYTICRAAGGGAAPAGGTGGGGAAAVGTTSLPTSQIGLRTYQSGQTGTTGTGGSAASNLAAIYRISAGIGGWGGGQGPTFSYAVDYAPRTQTPEASTAVPGMGGVNDLIKFTSSTGIPARGNTTGESQPSGNSGFGSGGPGGAAGGTTSGAGGNGGDGLVIITCG